MRVIRPRALASGRHRPLLLSAGMLGTGVLSLEMALVLPAPSTVVVGLAALAALALGIGAAWLVRVLRPDRSRSAALALEALLTPIFDDSYTLVLAPVLPVRDAHRLDGVLVGPAGVRILTVRDWVGRYRVRGRLWEFDARGRRGWIRCRTNPGADATALADGFSRWARGLALPPTALRAAVVFPRDHSKVVLEEPADEVVTADNAPWWAHRIGAVRRLDPAQVQRTVEAVLDAAEPARGRLPIVAVDREA